jgi:DNA replication protein DnaC
MLRPPLQNAPFVSSGHADGQLEERLTHYAKPKLLIVDGLGYLPFEAGCRTSVIPARQPPI